MNASLLNHLQGVKDYTFSGSVYKDKRLRRNWHVVKDIHKAHLYKHYRNPNLKGLRCISIDEFAVHKREFDIRIK